MKWKKYGKTWQEFRSHGLSKVGTILEAKGIHGHHGTETTARYLIGDINKLGGACDDCMAFDDDAIVLRYREVKLS